jgi:hypothetical protein
MTTSTIDNQLEFAFVERTRRKLQLWLALSRVLEETLADLFSAYTPLLAPLIPAVIGFENVQTGLGFGLPLAFLYAVVVECLGLATTTTALQFRAWNQEHDKPAPYWLALATAGFYLLIVLLVNVLLDSGTFLQKFVKAAASTFSIVGAVTLALRNEQAKRVAEIEQAKLNEQAEKERLDAEQRLERQAKRELRLAEKRLEHELRLAESRQPVPPVTPTLAESPVSGLVSGGKSLRWSLLGESDKQRVIAILRECQATHGETWKKSAAITVRVAFGLDERQSYKWLEYAERDAKTVVEVSA